MGIVDWEEALEDRYCGLDCDERRAASKERRAKSSEQRAASKERRAKQAKKKGWNDATLLQLFLLILTFIICLSRSRIPLIEADRSVVIRVEHS